MSPHTVTVMSPEFPAVSMLVPDTKISQPPTHEHESALVTDMVEEEPAAYFPLKISLESSINSTFKLALEAKKLLSKVPTIVLELIVAESDGRDPSHTVAV